MVVTARARLVERRGAQPETWPELLLAQVAGALEGGADLVQVREPDLDAGVLTRFLRRLFYELPDSARRVVVNDRADVAWVTGAAGVHLGERSLQLEDIRRLISADKKWVMGRSVHDPDTAARNRSASYLLAGTVLASASKPVGAPLLGWTGLESIVAAVDGTPVVAIGGLDAQSVAEAVRRGASGVAGIGCFLPDTVGDVASSVGARVRAMREAFPG